MRGKKGNPVPNGSLATRSSAELQGIRTRVHKRLLETLDRETGVVPDAAPPQ